MDLIILYEDNHLVIVDKPAGLLSQGDRSGAVSLLDMVREHIRAKFNKPGNVFTGLVHRLDRQVSGAMVFARTSKAASRLFQEFSTRKVIKIYAALVHRPRDTGFKPVSAEDTWITLTRRLVKDRNISRESADWGPGSRESALRYRIIAASDDYMLLLVHLLTGRKHQIRAQLSLEGLPVAGDELYGSLEHQDDGAICLHSYYLRFTHPTLKTPVEVFADIPSRFTKRIDIDLLKVKQTVIDYSSSAAGHQGT